MFFYTVAMIAGSVFILAMFPRAIQDLGQERQRLKEELPGASFERMLNASYRLNTILVLLEILYYLLLLRFAGDEIILLYGAFAFGLIHIAYLIMGRLERRRLASGTTRIRLARFLAWNTAILTIIEVAFLFFAGYFLLAS